MQEFEDDQQNAGPRDASEPPAATEDAAPLSAGAPEDGAPGQVTGEDASPIEDFAIAGEGAYAEPLPVELPAEPEGLPKKWFIIHTYSGFENKVLESLRTRSQAFGYSDKVGQVLIPTEEVVEMKNGKKTTSKRLLYPGYVIVELGVDEKGELDNDMLHHVKETPRVTGFVGGGAKPPSLTADEINSILYRQASSSERPRPKVTFEKNESVRIIDGPFTNFQGKVDEVNPDRNTLRVMVTIFGRSTPVELDFLQVEKVA